MKKSLCAVLIVASVSAVASVTPNPFFPTLPKYIETYDKLPVGSFPMVTIFSGQGVASKVGSGGAILVGHMGPPMSKPNTMFGRGVDIQIIIKPPMSFFGGYFKMAPAGVKVTKATFTFYGVNNAVIGTVSAPIGTAWKWIGYRTEPQWAKVVIKGNGKLPGYVIFDNTRVKT